MQMKRILDYIASGVKEGAKLVAGGGRFGDKGFFVEPTVFADVSDEMKIVKEEVRSIFPIKFLCMIFFLNINDNFIWKVKA